MLVFESIDPFHVVRSIVEVGHANVTLPATLLCHQCDEAERIYTYIIIIRLRFKIQTIAGK